jgi:hypothetical protein
MAGALNTFEKIRQGVELQTGSKVGIDLFCLWAEMSMGEIASAASRDKALFSRTWTITEIPGQTEYDLAAMAPDLVSIQEVLYNGKTICIGRAKLLNDEYAHKQAWALYGETLRIAPVADPDTIPDDYVPATITLCGVRKLQDEFYTIIETDNKTTYVSEVVNLPTQLKQALFWLVAAQAYMYCEDPGQAAVARQNADGQLKAHLNLVSRNAAGPLVMNSNSRRKGKCGPEAVYCPPPEEPECDCCGECCCG